MRPASQLRLVPKFEHTQPVNFCAADFESRRPLFAAPPTLRQRLTRAVLNLFTKGAR